MEFSTVGIVIKEQFQGENDKMLTILTPAKGKIHAYAKGVRKISSKNASACQLFVYSDFEIIEKNGRFTVKTAVCKEMFYNMRSSMEKYSLACYFADVVSHTSTELSDESDSLRLLLNALFALANMNEIPLWFIKGAFELKLMCVCGFMPDFSSCFVCGNEIGNSHSYTFSFEESAIICDKCKTSSSIPFSCTISGNTAVMLSCIASSEISKFLSFKYSDDIKEDFTFICENYLIHKTERTYETLKIYKSILNSLGEK